MGRKPRKLEYITNDRARAIACNQRKKTLFLKMQELMTLCGIKGCIIMYDNPRTKPQVWPSNRDEVLGVISTYKDKGVFRSYGLSDFTNIGDKKGSGVEVVADDDDNGDDDDGKLVILDDDGDDDDDEDVNGDDDDGVKNGNGKEVVADADVIGKGKLVIVDDDDDAENLKKVHKYTSRFTSDYVKGLTLPELKEFGGRLGTKMEEIRARIAMLKMSSSGLGVDKPTNLVNSQTGISSPVNGLVTDQQAATSSRPNAPENVSLKRDQQPLSFPTRGHIPLPANARLTGSKRKQAYEVPWEERLPLSVADVFSVPRNIIPLLNNQLLAGHCPVSTAPRTNDIPVAEPVNPNLTREPISLAEPSDAPPIPDYLQLTLGPNSMPDNIPASSLKRPDDASVTREKQQSYSLPEEALLSLPWLNAYTDGGPQMYTVPSFVLMGKKQNLTSTQQLSSSPEPSGTPVPDGHNNSSAIKQQDQQIYDDDGPMTKVLKLLRRYDINPRLYHPALWPVLLEDAIQCDPERSGLPIIYIPGL